MATGYSKLAGKIQAAIERQANQTAKPEIHALSLPTSSSRQENEV